MGTFNRILTFMIGATVGSIITGSIITRRYTNRCNEATSEEMDEYEEPDDEKDISSYKRVVHDNNYVPENEGGDEMNGPEIVSGEAYEDFDDYEANVLTYYEDGVLTDEHDNVITDRDNTVGDDFPGYFGEDEYDPDTVYVVNHDTKKKYEICMDYSNYADLYH